MKVSLEVSKNQLSLENWEFFFKKNILNYQNIIINVQINKFWENLQHKHEMQLSWMQHVFRILDAFLIFVMESLR
jgi:hypothetical protein